MGAEERDLRAVDVHRLAAGPDACRQSLEARRRQVGVDLAGEPDHASVRQGLE
jgi:hypothetical protein